MRPRIPWGRLSAEGAVILTSILLALAVQAWWEGRQERRQEAQHLAALRQELGEGLQRLPQLETVVSRDLCKRGKAGRRARKKRKLLFGLFIIT